ncbi:MAG: hypothetical protein AB7E32_16035 [Desulfovibrio sp.]
MGKFLSSSSDNIRFNGTGRCYMADVGSNAWEDVGELESINFNMSVSTEKIKSTRTAAKATLLERETEREATLSMGLREHTTHNLALALLGSDWSDANQLAGGVDLASLTFEADKYMELGHYDVYLTKISHDAVAEGPFTVGMIVTIGAVTAEIVWVGSGFIEVINPSGAVPSTGSVVSGAVTAAISGVEVVADVCLVDTTTPTKRYVQGADYTLDADYGLLRILSEGTVTTAAVAYSYKPITRKYNWMLSAGSVTKKVKFVADADDQGPREILTFHKVQVMMDGDMALLGDGESVLSLTGSVLADTSQSSGQEYFKLEIIQ